MKSVRSNSTGGVRGPYIETVGNGVVFVEIHQGVGPPVKGPFCLMEEDVFGVMDEARVVEIRVVGLEAWLRGCSVDEEREVALKMVAVHERNELEVCRLRGMRK